jgi:hypothetical protein
MDKQKNGFINKIMLATFFAGIFCNVFGTNFYEDKKEMEIVVTSIDSILKVHISTENKQIKTKVNNIYYWYAANHVFNNQGGYSGKLLIGEYRVFGKKGELLTFGNFKNGLKHGDWKYWNYNGQILKQESWRKGELNGTICEYTPEGKLYKRTSYRHGLKNGKEELFKADTVLVKKYKNGEIQIPKIKETNKKETLKEKKPQPRPNSDKVKQKKDEKSSSPKEEKKGQKKKDDINKGNTTKKKFQLRWPWAKKQKTENSDKTNK